MLAARQASSKISQTCLARCGGRWASGRSGKHRQRRIGRVAAELVDARVVDLALERFPVIPLAEGLAFDREARGDVVVGEVRAHLGPTLAEGSEGEPRGEHDGEDGQSRALPRHSLMLARFTRNAVLPGAPAGKHAVGDLIEHGFDAADFSVFDAEHFGEFPGPGARGAVGGLGAVRHFVIAILARGVIEEDEAEDQTSLGVDGDKAAIADAGDEAEVAGLELLLAAE